MGKKIKIMIIEDHPEYREIVGMTLGREGDLEIVSEFGTAERALRSFNSMRVPVIPDIVLLDLNLPGMDGLKALNILTDELPETKVIMLTQSDDESDVLKAIMLGASGYLLKSSTASQLVEGIRTVVSGGASLDSNIAGYVLSMLKSKLPKEDFDNLLSAREHEILILLAEGLVKKEIANQLNIGVTTVVTHVSNIYIKLDVNNAPAAIAAAFHKGILSV
jgi:DNA-binding NarL/FixJ family response regulator